MHRFDRRAVLAGALSLGLSRRSRAQDRVGAAHSSAHDFIESIGVNTHISSEPYSSRFDTVMRHVGDLGIRHLRDELRPSNDIGRWQELFRRHGVKSNMLVSPSTNTVAEMLAYIDKLGRDKLSAIEGQNEGNADWFMAHAAARGNWSRTVNEYQRDVFLALRQRYGPSLPVVSPSVINWKPADVALLRDSAPYCDHVAIHSYPQHAEEPETTADFADLAWYLKHMRDAFKPGAPVMATETGYNNTVKPSGSGVSEKAASIYLPRMLLHNFANGVERTFLYQLLDGGDDPAEWEHHFGLVRHDDTPKPAFIAISNLIGALRDAGEAAPTASKTFRLSLRNPSKTARMLALSHPNGTMTVALWRAVRSWDVEKATDIDVTLEPLTIVSDDQLRSVRMLVPNKGLDWRSVSAEGRECTVPAGAEVALVHLTPQV